MPPHSAWYEECRALQESWKDASRTLPPEARRPGTCFVDDPERGHIEVGPFPHCLPKEMADHNLLPGIRRESLRRFVEFAIPWHSYTPGPAGTNWPTTNLLGSQVQCVNVLLSLAADRGALLELARQAEPAALRLVDVESESPVAFEWIGERDHLGEGRWWERRRGTQTTSADAFMVAERPDGRTAILIEWKFTEERNRPIPPRGKRIERQRIYADAYASAHGPFRLRPPFEAFLHETPYQLFRLALLAAGMVATNECGVDRAVVLHVVPRANSAMLSDPTRDLAQFGKSVPDAWKALVPGRLVRYQWIDSLPWLSATAELDERYGSLRGAKP